MALWASVTLSVFSAIAIYHICSVTLETAHWGDHGRKRRLQYFCFLCDSHKKGRSQLPPPCVHVLLMLLRAHQGSLEELRLLLSGGVTFCLGNLHTLTTTVYSGSDNFIQQRKQFRRNISKSKTKHF